MEASHRALPNICKKFTILFLVWLVGWLIEVQHTISSLFLFLFCFGCTVPGYPGGLLAVLVGVPFIYVFFVIYIFIYFLIFLLFLLFFVLFVCSGCHLYGQIVFCRCPQP